MARKQRTSKETKELFRDPSGQTHLFEKSYQEEQEAPLIIPPAPTHSSRILSGGCLGEQKPE